MRLDDKTGWSVWLVVVALGAGCGASTPARDPGSGASDGAYAGPPAPCGASLLQELSPLVDGLLYPSESDFPVTPVSWTGVDLQPEAVAAAAGIETAGGVEVRPFESWFDRLTELREGMDEGQIGTAARFGRVRDWMTQRLTEPVVVRYGSVRIEVLVVGRDRCGGVAGFRTVAIET